MQQASLAWWADSVGSAQPAVGRWLEDARRGASSAHPTNDRHGAAGGLVGLGVAGGRQAHRSGLAGADGQTRRARNDGRAATMGSGLSSVPPCGG